MAPSAPDVQTMGSLSLLSVDTIDNIAAVLVECDNVLKTRLCVGEKNRSVPSESPSTTTSMSDFDVISIGALVL
jgi:hypothetical protein